MISIDILTHTIASYALTLAYPDDILSETARRNGIETEGREKNDIAKELFKKRGGVVNIDFDSFFRNKVESMLTTASWVEHVRHMLDLEGVSQVWGDKPEWYFWLGHAPGVYALILEDAESMVGENTTWNSIYFRMFPFMITRYFCRSSIGL